MNDPIETYAAVGIPGGAANFGGYDNPQVADVLKRALETANDAQRAALVIQAQAQIMKDLPWIPIVTELQSVPLNKRLAGVSVSGDWTYTPWLNTIGSAP